MKESNLLRLLRHPLHLLFCVMLKTLHSLKLTCLHYK